MKISLKQYQHEWIYFIGLALMAASLPLSKFTMSVSQFILVGNWLWEGNFRNKSQTLKSNKLIWVLLSVYLLHAIGLLWSSDLQYAFKDLRIKLPLLALPVIIGTSAPLDFKRFRALILLFSAAILVGTAISTYYYLGFSDEQIYEVRHISRFISHIRFSLLIVIAIAMLLWMLLFQSSRLDLTLKILLPPAVIWLCTFLFILDALIGIVTLGITIFCSIIWYILSVQNKRLRVGSLILITGVPLLAILYLGLIVKQHYGIGTKEDLSNLERRSAKGTYYYHDPSNTDMENGHYVWIYIANGELQEEWNKRSQLNFDSTDNRGNQVYGTVLRYMTSRGLRKDSIGVSQLSDEEITAIENGISSCRYFDKIGIGYRLEQTLFELDSYFKKGNPSGHSTTQRFEFWKAATSIIKENLLIGVGTGDVNDAFQAKYRSMNTSLDEKYWYRSHNQFLTIGVAFGILGMVVFLLSLVYPFIITRFGVGYLYTIFFLIMFTSMITEDTLETQAGVSFFAFFNTLLLFAQPGIDKLKRFQFLK